MENIGIGERIKVLRTGRGLSQVALSKVLNLNPQTIRDYETGRRSPTIKGLPALAKALDVSISELIEGSEELPPARSLPVSAMLKKFAAIPDDIYEKAQDFNQDEKVWDMVRAAFEAAYELRRSEKPNSKEA